MTKRQVALLAGVALCLATLSLSYFFSFLQSLRVVGGLASLAIFPGMIWTLSIWPRGTILPIMRLFLSGICSIILISLGGYITLRLGFALTLQNSIILISILTLIGGGVYFLKHLRHVGDRAHL